MLFLVCCICYFKKKKKKKKKKKVIKLISNRIYFKYVGIMQT